MNHTALIYLMNVQLHFDKQYNF